MVQQNYSSKQQVKNEAKPEQFSSMVREAAYFRFLKRGGSPGLDQSDWFESEKELRRKYQDQ